jgi:hypothetical protein
MALTLVNNSVQISSCDADDWDLGVGVLDTDFKYEGTGCLSIDTDIETNRIYYTISSSNFTGRHLLAMLMNMTSPSLDTKANGGMQLILVDSSGNEGYWYVGGSDTYSGGWKRYIIDAGSTPSANNGTNPTITAITKVGVGFKGIAKSKLTVNCYWDDVRYDTSSSRGIAISGGASGTPDDLDALLTADATTKSGQIRKEGGVFFLQGTFLFGHATSNLYFTDKNQLVVFENDLVADGYHKIKADCGTGTTEIFFGEKSGSDGIKGCLFKSGGTIKFQFDMSDTDIDKLGVYGCTFQDAGTITFQPTAADKEVLNATVDSSAEIIPNTIKFENFNIISSDGFGIRMIPSHGIKNGKIIAPGSSGIEIVPTAADQDFAFDNIVFSGTDGVSTYDVYSNTSYDLDVNATNGANPGFKNEAGSGTITINNPNSLTIYVRDETTQALLPLARVHVVAAAGGTMTPGDIIIDAEVTGADGKVVGNINASAQPFEGLIAEAVTPGLYVPKPISGTIPSGGTTLDVGMVKDE